MPTLPEQIPQELQNFLKNQNGNEDKVNFINTQDTGYPDIFKRFKMRGVVTKPALQQKGLLQLRLRAIFGVDIKTEVLIYFLVHEFGNSNSISKEVYSDQKNIYLILEKWKQAGIIEKQTGRKSGDCFSSSKTQWMNLLNIKEKPLYLNWPRFFVVVDTILKSLYTSPWENDIYLLSSLCKDLVEYMRRFEILVNMTIPDPNIFPGEDYFQPFTNYILDIFERLKPH